MSPRPYHMTARAQQVADSRQRIVAAAMELQAVKGAIGTNWDDIAERAGVATATVYRHFPTLEELIPACADSVFKVSGLPTPDQAARIFDGLSRPIERIERLVINTCDCYGRASGWLKAARGEQDLVPAMGRAVQIHQEGLRILIRAALTGRRVSHETERILSALIDFPFWRSLIDAGMSKREATAVVVRMVNAELGKLGFGKEVARGRDKVVGRSNRVRPKR